MMAMREIEKQSNLASLLLDVFLAALILTGVFVRLNWVNWSQDANLHPDEYGLTSTLTQLSLPDSLSNYLNTRISPLSPYPVYDEAGQKVHDGPDNRMRWGQWPIIILRAFATWTGNTGYGEQRLLGRTLSALADSLVLLLALLIGRRLYGRLAGLLGAALSALAVMQIQQSHFMTVDTFALLFVMCAMYCAVRAAQSPPVERTAETGRYRANRRVTVWYVLFGLAFGMAVASRINLAPLAGMIVIAAFISIADLRLRARSDLNRILLAAAGLLVLSGVISLVTFRACQPMTFRAETGDTGFFTLRPNPDWVESMKVAQNESSGIGGGPPGEQWAHRPAILFPLQNIVLWGMGLPLGLAAWGGFGWALAQVLRGRNWRAHLLPLVWVGGYFLFMGTRWVKSIRYFLPIYPFLCLFAAWALLELWRRAGENRRKRLIPAVLAAVVVAGTALWALAFVRAVYLTDHTRVQATRWILHNIPAPFNVTIQTASGTYTEPIGAPDGLVVNALTPYSLAFQLPVEGTLQQVSVARAGSPGQNPANLRIRIALDPEGSQLLAVAIFAVNPPPNQDERGAAYQAGFPPVKLQPHQYYYLVADTDVNQSVFISRTVIANESWDEGLPFPFENQDPFGSLYRGLTNEVRWADSPDKKTMFLNVLSQADYLILPSQRAIWSVARIPKTYPMTMAYYRALFDGRLGFDLAAHFETPMQIGPLYISDVGGQIALGRPPQLPLFNRNPLAAEEAFSVYDHPPVWIFKKRADFNIAQVADVLNAVDLSKVVIQGPRDADWDP